MHYAAGSESVFCFIKEQKNRRRKSRSSTSVRFFWFFFSIKKMSSSSFRLPTLRELDDKLNISGLRKNDEEARAAARKNLEEARKDLELQVRVDKIRERLRAMIEVRRLEGSDDRGEFSACLFPSLNVCGPSVIAGCLSLTCEAGPGGSCGYAEGLNLVKLGRALVALSNLGNWETRERQDREQDGHH